MSKKKWGYILIGVGVLRLVYEKQNNSTPVINPSGSLGNIMSYVDTGGGPGSSGLTYLILLGGVYLAYKG